MKNQEIPSLWPSESRRRTHTDTSMNLQIAEVTEGFTPVTAQVIEESSPDLL